eukprot:scaffold51419_cov50-Prasinocladus_malaysianus.AAC.1
MADVLAPSHILLLKTLTIIVFRCSASLGKFFSPFLKQVLPPEYYKWMPMIRRYAARTIGISIAWYLVRIISAVHSAVRGAQLIIKGLVGYAIRHGYVSKDIQEFDTIFNGIGCVIAAYGWFTQIR